MAPSPPGASTAASFPGRPPHLCTHRSLARIPFWVRPRNASFHSGLPYSDPALNISTSHPPPRLADPLSGFHAHIPGTPQGCFCAAHTGPCYQLNAPQGCPVSPAPRLKSPTSFFLLSVPLRGLVPLPVSRSGPRSPLPPLCASGTSVSPSLQPAPVCRLLLQPQRPGSPRPPSRCTLRAPLPLRPVPRPAPTAPGPTPTPPHPRGARPSPSPARPRAVPEPGSSLRPGPRTRCGGLSGPEERAEVPGGPGFPSRVPAAAGPRLPGAPGRRRRGRGRGGRGRGGARGGGVAGKGHRPETLTPQRRFRCPGAGRSHGPLPLSPGGAGGGRGRRRHSESPAPAPAPLRSRQELFGRRDTSINKRARRSVFAGRASRKGRAQVCAVEAGPSRLLRLLRLLPCSAVRRAGAGMVLSAGHSGKPRPTEGQASPVTEMGRCGVPHWAHGETEAHRRPDIAGCGGGKRGSSRRADGKLRPEEARRPRLDGARHRARCAGGNQGSARCKWVHPQAAPGGRCDAQRRGSYTGSRTWAPAAHLAATPGTVRAGNGVAGSAPPGPAGEGAAAARGWGRRERRAQGEKGRYCGAQPQAPAEAGGGQSCIPLSYQKELSAVTSPVWLLRPEDLNFKCCFS